MAKGRDKQKKDTKKVGKSSQRKEGTETTEIKFRIYAILHL